MKKITNMKTPIYKEDVKKWIKDVMINIVVAVVSLLTIIGIFTVTYFLLNFLLK